MEKLKLFIRSIFNGLAVLLGVDRNTIKAHWVKVGEQTDYSPEQVDGFVKRYDEIKPVIQMSLDFLEKEVRLTAPQGRILDYGCGSGRYLERLDKYTEYELFGVDLSPTIIENRTKKRDLGAHLFSANLAEPNKFVSQYKKSFDLIYSVAVLQSITPSGVNRLFDSFDQLLKEKGHILVHFAHPNSWLDIVSNLSFVRHTPRSLEKKLEKRGYEILYSGTAPDGRRVPHVDKSSHPNYGYWIKAVKKKSSA